MKDKSVYIGKEFESNYCGKFTVIDYINSKNVTVQFEDGTIIKKVCNDQCLLGKIRNNNYPTLYGVGFIGYGEFKLKSKAGNIWKNIMTRGYNEKCKNRKRAYKDIEVCKEWHNFQNFAKWHKENWNPKTMQDWELDKDLLLINNKVYSPETCCLLPPKINKLLIKSIKNSLPQGVYKEPSGLYRASFNSKTIKKYINAEEAFQAYKDAKERHIKEVIKEYKTVLPEKTYEKLKLYQVTP